MINPLKLKPREFLSPLLSKKNIRANAYDQFSQALTQLQDSINPNQDEEHNKKFIQTFLEDAYYRDSNHINTNDKTDLAIYSDKSARSSLSVLIETKKPGKSGEMVTTENFNTKAMWQLVLYYFREKYEKQNLSIKHLAITDGWQWFVFDANDFDRIFGQSKSLKKDFEAWNTKGLLNTKNETFYQIVESFIDTTKRNKTDLLDEGDPELPYAWFDIRNIKSNSQHQAIYKLLSPDCLLKAFNPNDANSLNRDFYTELLHIIGVEEFKEKGKKQLRRKDEKSRHPGAILENAFHICERHGTFKSIGETHRFDKTLELCMVWVNRILFLKLLESQIVRYHKGDASLKFLHADTIPEYDELDTLFFDVLAKKPDERSECLQEKFSHIPYLNSSLFEDHPVEKELAFISGLSDSLTIPYSNSTVLTDTKGKRKSGEVNTIQYLFEFLDAYDFSSESGEEVVSEQRSLISASVLGLVFEKINGYKEGSFYTPGFITMHMAKETITKTVLQKFNDAYEWECDDLDALCNKLEKIPKDEANALIDSITVCDPAVGSGHFLVSCLNEMIAIKSELGILCDESGKRLRDWKIVIENDELSILNDDGEPLHYLRPKSANETHRVQKTLFQQKRQIIENSLFGVDINPNSVNICRLRLWIELLKHAYYTEDSGFKQLETLPNIDINIKCGNSLISRYPLDDAMNDKKDKKRIARYRDIVQSYKDSSDKGGKAFIEQEIEELKKGFSTNLQEKGKKSRELQKKMKEYIEEFGFEKLWDDLIVGYAPQHYALLYLRDKNASPNQTLIETEKDSKKQAKALKTLERLYFEIDEIIRGVVYENAFEWRFEYPEALDEEGEFKGFDIVIGNPPYIRQEELGERVKKHFKELYQVYAGTADIYAYFVEKAFALLKPSGHFAYIFPNKWMRAGYGKNLRNFLKSQKLLDLIDFGDLPVFEEATTYPMILLAEKSEPTESFHASEVDSLKFESVKEYVDERNKTILHDSLDESGWVLADIKIQKLLDKLKQNGVPLGEYVDGEIYRGVLTGLNEAFVIDSETKERLIAEDSKSAEVIKPFLAGKDVKRYRIPEADKYLIFTRRGIDIEQYSAIKNHLEQFRERLEPKPSDWDSSKGEWKGRKPGPYKWYEVQDTVAYWEKFEKTKIIYPEISMIGNFSIDSKSLFGDTTTYIIDSPSVYLLAFLNSKIFTFLFSTISSEIRGGFLRWKRQYMENVPLPRIDSSDSHQSQLKSEIESKVQQILTLRKADPNADTQALEKEIDSLVYELYGLDKEEINIIEGRC